jgi:hypothetical protein
MTPVRSNLLLRANNTLGNQLSSAPACNCTSLPQPLARASQRCPAQEAAKCGVQLYQADSRYQPIGLHLLASLLRHPSVCTCWRALSDTEICFTKGFKPWSSLLLTVKDCCMCHQPSADKQCLAKVTADDNTSSEHDEGAHNCMWKQQTHVAVCRVDSKEAEQCYNVNPNQSSRQEPPPHE